MKQIAILFVFQLLVMILLIKAENDNWNSTTLISSSLQENSTQLLMEEVVKKCLSPNCPNGWIHYESSCYFISRWDNRKSYLEARLTCLTMSAKMFSSDSQDEWNTIMQNADRLEFTWIGITVGDWRHGEAEFFKWEDDNSDWSPQLLPWLTKATATRGHYSTANCVSYFGADTEENSYVHWYPCETTRYFICERNNTIPMN